MFRSRRIMFVMFTNKHKHSSYEEQGSEFAVVSNGMEEEERREREREFLVLTYLYFTGSFRSGGRKGGGGE